MPPLDIRFVQTHLRHTSLASTQIYTHVDPAINAEQVKGRLNKFFQEIEYIRVQTRPSDLLSQLSQGTSHFKGCWRNLHGLEFPSARRYFVLHAKPSDCTDAGTHEAICDPTSFTSVCQRTDQYPARNSNLFTRFHLLSCERGIPARKC